MMSFKRFSSVLGLLLLLPAFASADWRILQLTDDSYAESMPAVYLDSFNVPHFAWCSNDDGDYDIYYLEEPAGIPLKVTINSTQDLYPCLQLDLAGNAHIGFKGHDGHDYEEYYVNNVGGAFCEPIQASFTSTDVGVFVPERSCLAIDSLGVAHIVYKYGYYEYGNWDIYYVNNEGGSFGASTRITDEGGSTSYVRPSLALDSNASVHVAFEDGTSINYTNNAGGSFDTLTVVSTGAIRWHASLGIDSVDDVHISYGGYHGGVYYVNNSSGGFGAPMLLSGDNSVNGPTSLGVDLTDHIHVAYVGGIFGNTNSQELYYVSNISGAFEDPEQITYNTEHTTDISSCTGLLCGCHIAYLEGFYGSNDYEVWYATNAPYNDVPIDARDRVRDAGSHLLQQNWPNPFRATTQIHYTLDMDSRVHLSVYNILGERVATLVDELQEAGPHVVSWNGRSARGRELPVGVYFCRFASDGVMATRQLVLER